jgi:hypothetical protein
MKEKIKELAKYEVGWWRAHHYRNYEAVLENMTLLYQRLFNISKEKAEKAVRYRVEAGKMHDEAERLEDLGNKTEAEKFWKKTEELLGKHFEVLLSE